jgi:type IX secretion system PorP/SprF family membrane protein
MDMICVTGIYRNAMVGFPGKPENFFFNVEAPFNIARTKHGVGLSMYRDAIGFNSDINFQLGYAFRVSIGDGTLGIGINGSLFDKSLDPEWQPSEDVNLDDNIPSGDADMTFSIGAGLFYRREDIYFGASVLNINNPEVIAPSGNSENNESKYNLNRHYYVTTGYNMQLTNPAWEIKPAVLLKSDGTATDMDFNLTVAYNKKFWGGVSYRTAGTVIGMIGFQLFEGLKIGYSYDFPVTTMMKYQQGTHEILLNYCFKIGVEKAPQKYKSIRYL